MRTRPSLGKLSELSEELYKKASTLNFYLAYIFLTVVTIVPIFIIFLVYGYGKEIGDVMQVPVNNFTSFVFPGTVILSIVGIIIFRSIFKLGRLLNDYEKAYFSNVYISRFESFPPLGKTLAEKILNQLKLAIPDLKLKSKVFKNKIFEQKDKKYMFDIFVEKASSLMEASLFIRELSVVDTTLSNIKEIIETARQTKYGILRLVLFTKSAFPNDLIDCLFKEGYRGVDLIEVKRNKFTIVYISDPS